MDIVSGGIHDIVAFIATHGVTDSVAHERSNDVTKCSSIGSTDCKSICSPNDITNRNTVYRFKGTNTEINAPSIVFWGDIEWHDEWQ